MDLTSSDVMAPFAMCEDGSCPVARAVAALDGKWTVLVIRELMAGTQRFGHLRSALPGVSPKTLTDRLRSLEQSGLVSRTMYAEIPPRVEYDLTDLGRRLEPVLAALAEFGRGLASDQISGLVRVGGP